MSRCAVPGVDLAAFSVADLLAFLPGLPARPRIAARWTVPLSGGGEIEFPGLEIGAFDLADLLRVSVTGLPARPRIPQRASVELSGGGTVSLPGLNLAAYSPSDLLAFLPGRPARPRRPALACPLDNI